MEAFSSNTFHLIQCANSIFLNDFLGRIQFKFAHTIQENYSKNWTFDQKMCIHLQFSYGAHSIQTSYCIRVDMVCKIRTMQIQTKQGPTVPLRQTIVWEVKILEKH